MLLDLIAFLPTISTVIFPFYFVLLIFSWFIKPNLLGLSAQTLTDNFGNRITNTYHPAQFLYVCSVEQAHGFMLAW